MPYALVPMIPFVIRGRVGSKVLSVDYGGNCVRLTDTLAIAWTPDPIPDVRAKQICNDKADVPGSKLTVLQDVVSDRTLDSGTQFSDLVGNLLRTPPPGWSPLAPTSRGQYEVLLGPGGYLGAGDSNPGLLWSEPVAAKGK